MTTIKLHMIMRRLKIAKSEFDAWENNDSNGKPLVRIRAIANTSLDFIYHALKSEGYEFQVADSEPVMLGKTVIGIGFRYLKEVAQ